jgi:uncharacterized membrane protein YidH (DUF202 family)
MTGRHVASQPSLAPTRKVTAVFGGGAAVTLLIFATRRVVGYDLDPELAGLIITAAVTAAGYATREYAQATASRARHAPRPPADDAGFSTVEVLLFVIVVMLFILVAVTTGVRIDV